ncbi:hypothetical protein E0489_13145 [Thermus tengchongensis]|uniref:Transposase n=1 Tax=Thermus tengchongensis TaxID=1214928 RepID=A0ABY2K6T9_9DEIN|nr:hypothetical protein E0489_13145 [Thermus tengchongensis]
MALALLVYTLGEWELRRRLEGEGVPDQKGKPTARPTLRWVFQPLCEIRATPVTWLRLVVLEGRVAVLNSSPIMSGWCAFKGLSGISPRLDRYTPFGVNSPP